MSLVTDLKHSAVSTAWGNIISKHASRNDFIDIGVDPTEGSLSRRFYSVFARSVVNEALTPKYDLESQHILFVNNKGDWKARFKSGAMRASYETCFYEFFTQAGHEYGACPVATAIIDLSSLPPIQAENLNSQAFDYE